MKFATLLTAFVLFASIARSQIGLGLNEKQVREFVSKTDKLDVVNLDSTRKVWKVESAIEDSDFYERLYFFKDDFCYLYTLKGKTDKISDIITNICNTDYIKLEDNLWQCQVRGKTIIVRKSFIKDVGQDVFFFYFTDGGLKPRSEYMLYYPKSLRFFFHNLPADSIALH